MQYYPEVEPSPSFGEEIVGAFVGNGFTDNVPGAGMDPNAPSGGKTETDWSWVCMGHVHDNCSQLGTP